MEDVLFDNAFWDMISEKAVISHYIQLNKFQKGPKIEIYVVKNPIIVVVYDQLLYWYTLYIIF